MAESFRIADNQAGGHNVEVGKKGFLLRGDKLYKPLQSGKRGNAEVNFYAEVKNSKDQLFLSLIPRYFGVEQIQDQDGLTSYLVMENLTHIHKHPVILDLKMGVRTADEDATPEFVERRRVKELNSTTPSLGFRIAGLKGWDDALKQRPNIPPKKCKNATTDTVKDVLKLFIVNGTDKPRKDVLPPILESLKALVNWFETSNSHRFYAASVLCIYEGDTSSTDAKIVVKLIDFTHVFPIKDGGKDDGFIFGLKNVINLFEQLLHE